MNARPGLDALLALAALTPAVAQRGPGAVPDPAALVAALGGDADVEAEAVAAERALRLLCALPRERLPVDLLRQAARRAASHRLAVWVLFSHGALTADDLFAADRSDSELAPLAVAPLDEAALRALLVDTEASGHARRAALLALQDRGRFGVDDAVPALADGDPHVSGAACAVLRWEWRELPTDLLRRVRGHERARQALLHALGDAPRPSADAWAIDIARDAGVPDAQRLWAVGASSAADRELALFVLRSLLGPEVPPLAFRAAVERIPGEVADRLVGEVHRLCEQGLDPGLMLPFLERLTPKGAEQLLGLAVALDAKARETLGAFLAQIGSPGYAERVRAALDGEIALEPHLLPRAGSLLDRPARVQRVLALLRDPAQPEPARAHAFSALLAAGVDGPELLEFARADASGERAIQWLHVLQGPMPEDFLREVLGLGVPAGDEARAPRQDERLRHAALAAMERRGVPAGLEPDLLEICRDESAERDPRRLRDATAAARALAMGGSEAACRELWRAVRYRPALRDDVLEWSAIGKRPWAHALLLAELVERKGTTAEDRALRGRIRALLVELGDRRELKELIADAAVLQARWLRRARAVAPAPDLEPALQLLREQSSAEPDTAVEMVLWAGGCERAEVQDALLRLWQETRDPELGEAALRGLMRGRHRTVLLAELDRALSAGALDARQEMVAYEALATLPERADAGELRRIAELFLLLPLRTPEAELARALRFPGGRAGFPMAQAIGYRLRRRPDPGLPTALAAAAQKAAADPAAIFLSRQRLTCLFYGAAADRGVQRELGIATAALLLAIPDPRGPGEGASRMFLGEDAEERGAFAEAAAHFRRAARALLRGGAEAMAARAILGERDPQAGADPFAALAARPWLCEAQAALAGGDHGTARAHLRVALDLGHPDASTRKLAASLMEQTR